MLAAGRPTMGLQRQGIRQRPRSAVPRGACRRVAMRQNVASCAAASPQWPARLAVAIQQQPVVLLACQAVVACHRMVSALRDTVSRAFPQLQDVRKEVRRQAPVRPPRRRPPAAAAARVAPRMPICHAPAPAAEPKQHLVGGLLLPSQKGGAPHLLATWRASDPPLHPPPARLPPCANPRMCSGSSRAARA
jgi:hypothetical protein